MEKAIAVIDMKAFYAFIECVDRKLNPFTTPLVVCDTERGNNTIVLSVSPYLKAMGVPSRCRRKELPDIKGIIFATPRMKHYVEKSAEIVSIVLDFVGEDDIHVYSIDELFINLGPYLKMYNATPRSLTMKIQKEITKRTGLVTTAGVSYNMLLAKVALDTDAKKKPPYISVWGKEDIEKKLWKLSPLSKMWGISSGYERKLNALGIYNVGQLAKANKDFLRHKFGVMGEQLWEHANGIDNTNLRDKYIPEDTSLSLGQVLIKDYTPKQARLILKEMNDDLARRLREHGKQTKLVGLSVAFSSKEGGGFSHNTSLDFPTDDTDELFNDLVAIYDKYIGNHFVKGMYIRFAKLSSDGEEQLSLFEEQGTSAERKALTKVIDELKNKYGKNIVLRGSSLLEESTAKERHNQIGGHRK